jgi:hypothetical protein
MIFQDHRRVPVNIFKVKIAASDHLKRVSGRIFRIKKGVYIEINASNIFTFIFLFDQSSQS